MGTGAKYYCMGCLEEREDYELDPDTGWCFKCLDTIDRKKEGEEKDDKIN